MIFLVVYPKLKSRFTTGLKAKKRNVQVYEMNFGRVDISNTVWMSA
jgi:hypothetical protein